jgi:hypothetical protein
MVLLKSLPINTGTVTWYPEGNPGGIKKVKKSLPPTIPGMLIGTEEFCPMA